jgi:hypothetical protein
MGKLSLPWPVDRDGYRLEAEPALKGRAAKTIAGSGKPRLLIMPAGGKQMFKDVLATDALYRRLADCSANKQGALKFVSEFGVLGRSRFEAVDSVVSLIKNVRALLRFKEKKDWEALEDWAMDNSKAFRFCLEFHAGDPPQFFFKPVSLKDAIYAQFFQDVATGTESKLCKRPGCGTWFYYGAGVGTHRSTAEYCSPKCQKAHAYANKTQERVRS